ncbi:hypothetical protein AK812_SmicGene16593 [Symbiodinium microadriaticum]|uniref:Uncharacterized protein n=1 Tax=Symbiodinium microadriaticum TaxID=2951 RepID=A0A1Q9DZW7_SYMMI|nr:hypothetical protein AK812_SmicGene16593 [Symbiodinium microadriaticum]
MSLQVGLDVGQKEKVLSFGRPVVAIEMNWSTSGYLPGVEVVGFMTPDDGKIKKQNRRMRMYDRFSEWERHLPESVASNQSNVHTSPSRIGAFEVHVVQGAWYPELCPGQLQPGEKHQGGAVVLYILHRLCQGHFQAKAGEVPSSTLDQASLDSQHALLHSKLWSRRWPALRALLIQIGILTIGPPPAVAPVPPEVLKIQVEMPTRLEELSAEPLEFDPIPLPDLPEVPPAPHEPSIGGAPQSPQRPEFSENELLIRWALARLACSASDPGALDAELGADTDDDLVDGFDFRKKKAHKVRWSLERLQLHSGHLPVDKEVFVGVPLISREIDLVEVNMCNRLFKPTVLRPWDSSTGELHCLIFRENGHVVYGSRPLLDSPSARFLLDATKTQEQLYARLQLLLTPCEDAVAWEGADIDRRADRSAVTTVHVKLECTVAFAGQWSMSSVALQAEIAPSVALGMGLWKREELKQVGDLVFAPAKMFRGILPIASFAKLVPYLTVKGMLHSNQSVTGLLMPPDCIKTKESRVPAHDCTAIGLNMRKSSAHAMKPPGLTPSMVAAVFMRIACVRDSSCRQNLLDRWKVILEECKEHTKRGLNALAFGQDCPANYGWSVVGQGADELLCRCGGGSHQLNITSVTNILKPLGYSEGVFRSHVGKTRSKYVQRNMIELVNGFLKEHGGRKPENLEELQEQYESKMEMERRRLKAEYEQACKYRKQVEAIRKDIQAKMDVMRGHQRRLTHRQQELCQAFRKAVEKGWEEAFVDHVLSLAELVPGFRHQERGSVEEADDAIQAALGLNEERRQAWENWRQRWSDVPEVLKTVAQAEPQVSAEVTATMEESARSAASALRSDFATKIRREHSGLSHGVEPG